MPPQQPVATMGFGVRRFVAAFPHRNWLRCASNALTSQRAKKRRRVAALQSFERRGRRCRRVFTRAYASYLTAALTFACSVRA